jgi:hypothetical protein
MGIIVSSDDETVNEDDTPSNGEICVGDTQKCHAACVAEENHCHYHRSLGKYPTIASMENSTSNSYVVVEISSKFQYGTEAFPVGKDLLHLLHLAKRKSTNGWT